ncbi:hypothetical protein OG884_23235 [Streptosporangium sp. NBC_01755]|uniref:hypothetical protein n=1 Tax=unclassified Streptosporangium TaxID=2632669 RepID=UPI002DDBB72A|nr:MULTISPECIES: hypothetical protein [unclassified Streptosporangium]WSA24127.1 hypothetical protein OIE13_24685 [Streptosporangium sp. NBC_01810]WSC97799.1 hypothetical protein OG884_23235 [Streptosporangium sp. NBC_01755]
MDSSNGRILTLVVVAAIVFAVGRLFQRTMDTWAGWGNAIKAAAEAASKIPDAKSAAWKAVRRMIGVGLIALIVLAAAVNVIRYG